MKWRWHGTNKRERITSTYRPLLRLLRQFGVVEVLLTEEEKKVYRTPEFQAIVSEWPVERIRALKDKCAVPVPRLVALLGIGRQPYDKLCRGDYTPSAGLCRRMQAIEQMAESGQLHPAYVPKSGEMQRRMALFRAWFMARPPTAEFPLLTVRLEIRWGRSVWQKLALPVESLPALRIKEWRGLADAIQAVTVAVRKLAKGNMRGLWKEMEEEYWRRYATDTLPAIVQRSAKIPDTARQRRLAYKRLRTTTMQGKSR